MWVIYVEAALAVGMLLFIVWWTWPTKSDKRDRPQEDQIKPASAPDEQQPGDPS